jgi:hypothetical protein
MGDGGALTRAGRQCRELWWVPFLAALVALVVAAGPFAPSSEKGPTKDTALASARDLVADELPRVTTTTAAATEPATEATEAAGVPTTAGPPVTTAPPPTAPVGSAPPMTLAPSAHLSDVVETDGPDPCHPAYGGCVPMASDVDCAGGNGNGPAYVEGPVEVRGSDPYRLDDDDNGVGCD